MQQVTGGIVRANCLRHRAEDRSGIQLEHNPEGGRPRYFLTSQDGVLNGSRTAPGGQQREMQVDPTVLRNIQHPLWQQRAVRHDWTAIWGKLAEPRNELLVPRPLRLQDLQTQLGSPLCNRTGGQLLAPATRSIRPGDDSDQLMAGIGEGIQRRNRDIWG